MALDIPSGNGGETTIERDDSLPDPPHLRDQWWIELWNQNKEAAARRIVTMLERCQQDERAFHRLRAAYRDCVTDWQKERERSASLDMRLDAQEELSNKYSKEMAAALQDCEEHEADCDRMRDVIMATKQGQEIRHWRIQKKKYHLRRPQDHFVGTRSL